MIVAHLSDLHLGFRAWDAARDGRNGREGDVADAFRRVLDEVVRIRPSVVVVTGDVFDRPDPPASAMVTLTRGLGTLREALPDCPVLLLAGPRDTPLRSDEPGPLAVADTLPGVEAATGAPRRVRVGGGGLSVLLLPRRSLVPPWPDPDPRPDPDVRWNVLAVHARPETPARGGRRRRARGPTLEAGEWDYVALGGDHRHRSAAGNALFAGAPERVGWTPWTEALEEKGFVAWDLEAARGAFHPVPVRPVVALAPIRVPPGDPERLRERISEVTGEVPGGVEGKVVRLRLRGPSPSDLRALQDGTLAGLMRRVLHLSIGLDGREPPAPPADARLAALLEEEGEPAEGLADRAAGLLAAASRPRVASPTSPVRRLALPGSPGPGQVVPDGLVALVSRGSAGRRVLLGALAEASGGALGDAGADRDASAGEMVEVAARAVAGGTLARVEAVLARLAGDDGGAAPDDGAEPDRERRMRELEGAPREMRALERELRELRADDAEAAGDVEQAAMEWLRERQDAETQLHAYRDRARELKARLVELDSAGPETPCPTCGRALTDHLEEVVARLRDEWEGVVQDGRWWKRRRDQLEDKPQALREMEGRAVRIHAAMEACAERLERTRVRVAELEALRAGADPRAAAAVRRGAGSVGGVADGGPEARVRALRRLGEETLAAGRRTALSRASRLVARLTASRVLLLEEGDVGLVVHGPDGPLSSPGPEDLAAARLALRIVLAAARTGGGRRRGMVALPGGLDGLEDEDRLRAVDLLRELLAGAAQVVVVAGPEAVERRPEAFDAALEAVPGGEGGSWELRSLPVGEGVVVLAAVDG